MTLALPYLKSLAALVGSVATALLALYADNETLTIVAVIATAVGTWAIPNLDPAGRHQDESVMPDERGATTGELVLIVIGVVALLWLVVHLAR